jgi:peptidoglycan/LPS O-acetylase OafA/YrhL
MVDVPVSARAKHLFLLDILRGIASLAVVVYHYRHFYYVGVTIPDTFSSNQMPFYSELSVLYQSGWCAVDLFFVISGFVFFYQYADEIRLREIGIIRFAVLRFSRLYPLHFVTLILVALSQVVSKSIDGVPVVYSCNTSKQFVLNLFFATNWRPGMWNCMSFNGPVWSVSVEAFLYVLFFVFCLALPKNRELRLLMVGAAILFGCIAHFLTPFELFGWPVICFYAGGLVFILWERMHEQNWSRPMVGVMVITTFSVGTVLFFIFQSIDILFPIVFPSTVFCLVLLQDVGNDIGKRFRVIGDITYSTYLLHFPVAVLLVLLNKSGVISLDFHLKSVWLLYMTLVVGLSIPTYNYFERPVQRFIRNIALPAA